MSTMASGNQVEFGLSLPSKGILSANNPIGAPLLQARSVPKDRETLPLRRAAEYDSKIRCLLED